MLFLLLQWCYTQISLSWTISSDRGQTVEVGYVIQTAGSERILFPFISGYLLNFSEQSLKYVVASFKRHCIG